MNDKDKLEFLMDQMNRAADIRIKLVTERCDQYGQFEVGEILTKAYKQLATQIFETVE